MMKYADGLPKNLTYQQAFDMNAMNTKQYLGIHSALTDQQRDAAVEDISKMSDKEKTMLLRATARDFEMAEAYKSAGDDPEKKALAVKQYPDLKTAYDGEKALKNELGVFATPAVMQQYKEIAIETISSGGLDNMRATLDAKQHVIALPEPEYVQHEHGRGV